MAPDLSYYEGVPLPALKSLSRSLISTSLNGPKVIPSPEGFLRDWRGLDEIASTEIRSPGPDPSGAVISAWEKQLPRPTFKDLIEALKRIDRFDVLEDLSSLLHKDAEYYYNIKGTTHNAALCGNLEDDGFVLTIADLHRRERGEPPQTYDAFLLYDEADTCFAESMVETLEDRYNLKLCLKERDLLGGFLFEHEIITKLIAERCSQVIVIVSPNFLSSPMNRFVASFAMAQGIMCKKRKIVPCIYNLDHPPMQFSVYVNLFFNPNPNSHFWTKLYASIYQPKSPVAPPVYQAPQMKSLPSPPLTDCSSILSDNDSEGALSTRCLITSPEPPAEQPESPSAQGKISKKWPKIDFKRLFKKKRPSVPVMS